MYRNLFTAWYCLGVLALWLAVWLILLPFVGVYRAQSSFAVTGLLGFLPFFWFFSFRNTIEDERDISYRQKAVGFGFASGWGVIFFVSGVVYFFNFFVLGSDSIPLTVFWIPAICGMVIGMLAGSVALLLLYHKGERALEEELT